jgi:hypothetical protein
MIQYLRVVTGSISKLGFVAVPLEKSILERSASSPE